MHNGIPHIELGEWIIDGRAGRGLFPLSAGPKHLFCRYERYAELWQDIA